MEHSEQDINRGVRSVLTRHWVDLTKTSFLSRRGILRMTGELQRLGAAASTKVQPTALETLDQELKRVRGVRHVYYDFANWRRSEDGEWRQVVSLSEQRGKAEGEGGAGEPDGKAEDE